MNLNISDHIKSLSFALAVLILIIVVVFLFSSKNEGTSDILIPSPEATRSAETSLFTLPEDRDTVNNKEQPFKVLDAGEIQGKKSVIETDKGTIVFELFGDAPLAASNYVSLAQEGFYDGLNFHRREEGFVIQGGDPSGDGTGGPGYKFEDEAVTKDYERGIVAMANAGPNTNGSQFFIMLEDAPSLPKSYTIFGRVVEGIDVVDEIQVGDVMKNVTIE